MGKQQTIIQVFVGSPGDVAEERQHAFAIIDRINDDVLMPDGWRFEGIGWDQTHYSKLAWLSPQQAINQGIPQPGECDIALFIFWKRVGTPLVPDDFIQNGAGSEPTGSLWEFHNAMEATPKPWTLVYRCERVPVMSKEDLQDPVGFGRQIEGVNHFFAQFQDAQKRYTNDYQTFSDTSDFAVRLENDLKRYIKQHSSAQNSTGSRSKTVKETGEPVPAAYLNRLKQSVAQVQLLGLDLKESITNGLPQVYVPAMTSRIQKKPEQVERFEAEQRELMLHRLGEQSLYMPGDPGSGKSTFTHWVSYLVAHGSVPVNAVIPPDQLQEELPQNLRGRLPVLIRLRDFWAHMGCRSGEGDWCQNELETAIMAWLDKTRPFGLTADTFSRNLKQNNLLLIFDGIDEVPEKHHENGQCLAPRQALLSGLADALPQWQAQGQRILLTSRPYGLSPAQRARLNLPEARLLLLDRDQQQLFIERWFATADHSSWQDNANGLNDELRQRQELGQLRRNPLLLTALCVKYKEGKRLPHDIYQLYNSVVDQVLYNRFRSNDRDRQKIRWRLEAVALGMHYGKDEKIREAPLVTIAYDELDRTLAQYAELNPNTEGGADEVLERRSALLERSGLLLPGGIGQAEFYHQDLRDFLAAERWIREDRSLQDALRQFGTKRDWRRMLGFLFAKVIESTAGIDRPLQALTVLENSLNRADVIDTPSALLLSDCLEIANGKSATGGLDKRWITLFRRVCSDALHQVPMAEERNALLLTLGRLGWDDRPGVGLDGEGIPDIEWLAVGDRNAPDYYIARYPVTQAQFQAFIDAGNGYSDPRWWRNMEKRRRAVDTPAWPESNAPKTNVDWFEANAFCRWLSHTGKSAEPGWSIGLPTDQEWQLAYVGAAQQDFPWSGQTDPDRHANYGRNIGRTSVVGLFPAGEADSGALDMAGNVWEWCQNVFDPDKNLVTENISVSDSSDSRVLRGGSWLDSPNLLRSALRYRSSPDYRTYLLGFRVVCRPPS